MTSEAKKTIWRRLALHAVRLALLGGVLYGGYEGYKRFSAMRKDPNEKARERLVKTLVGERVKAEDVRLTVSGYGTAESATRVRISPQLNGLAVAVKDPFDDGVLVKKGERLVEIDKEDYEIALSETKSELDRLRAELAANEQDVSDAELILHTVARDLEIERKDFDRIKALRRKDVISESTFDQAAQEIESKKNLHISGRGRRNRLKIQRRSIEAQIEMAEARKRKAELNIRRAVLRSPFDGRLENVQIDAGDYLTVGQVVCDVVDDADLEIPVAVPAFAAYQNLELRSCETRGYANWIECPPDTAALIKWTRDGEARRWDGKVVRIENLNPSTRTLTIVVAPVESAGSAESELPLITGMFCEVEIEGETLRGAFRIPLAAVRFNEAVFVADETGMLRETPMKIVHTADDDVIVSDGLSDGDVIVTQSIPRGVVNGTTVRVITTEGKPLTNPSKPTPKTTVTKPEAREATSNG